MRTFMQDLIEGYEISDMERPAFLDLYTGEIVIDEDESISGVPGIDWDDEESDERYVALPEQDSSEEYKWMENFVAQLNDYEQQKVLFKVLDRPKPFRNFKDAVFDLGVREDWFKFRDKMIEEEIVDWLKLKNINVLEMENLRNKQ